MNIVYNSQLGLSEGTITWSKIQLLSGILKNCVFECIEIKDRENHKNEDGRNKLEDW